MSVTARFFVQSTTRFAHNPGQLSVKLTPVSRGPENKQWATATPSGSIELNIQNPNACDFFADRLGKELAITFEDRPLLCMVCREEVPAGNQYESGGTPWSPVDEAEIEANHYAPGSIIHTACR